VPNLGMMPVRFTRRTRAPPRRHICINCSGNMCRKPMGEVIPAVELQSTVLRLPGSRFAGTGRWHESHGADPHTARIARRGV